MPNDLDADKLRTFFSVQISVSQVAAYRVYSTNRLGECEYLRAARFCGIIGPFLMRDGQRDVPNESLDCITFNYIFAQSHPYLGRTTAG